MAAAIEVRGVSKRFRLYHERYSSLKERVIHFGRSRTRTSGRCATSTSRSRRARPSACSGTTARASRRCSSASPASCSPTDGRDRHRGSRRALLELGAGFHPRAHRPRERLPQRRRSSGCRRTRHRPSASTTSSTFAELEQFIDTQVKHYSSGMYVRLGFAVAVNVDPDILLVDEVLAVGDEAFQRKCLDRVDAVPARGPHDRVRHPRRRPGAPDLRPRRRARPRRDRDRRRARRGGAHVPRIAPTAARADARSLPVSEDAEGAAAVDAMTAASHRPDQDQRRRRSSIPARRRSQLVAPRRTDDDPGRVSTPRRRTDVMFGIAFYDANGNNLFGTNTRILDVDVPPASGDGEVAFEFARVPLLDGTYWSRSGSYGRRRHRVRLAGTEVHVRGDEPVADGGNGVVPGRDQFASDELHRVEGS